MKRLFRILSAAGLVLGLAFFEGLPVLHNLGLVCLDIGASTGGFTMKADTFPPIRRPQTSMLIIRTRGCAIATLKPIAARPAFA